MAIIGIVAIDQQQAIGKDGKLPWHYPADMRFFKETTIGNTVVMGRHTWLTLKGALRDRTNIVLSRDGNIATTDPIIVMRNVESVVEFAREQETDLFVIGGAKVYAAFLPHIERWIVTEVPVSVAGADTFMPANFLDGFELYELRQLDQNLRVKFYERLLSR